MSWWQDAVLYQVYLRSFADSDGDGFGDLRGLLGRLDHLSWLGVDAVWLSPVHPSPDRDWGYDVADYYGVHPELGSLRDLDELIRAAGERGIKVLLDLVPNHTSDQHPWFADPARRDWYVWADRPNNWLSHFGGPAWTELGGAYYLHNFLASQPDLNWWNPEVRAEFERILRFWFERGVAGFRIDVCHGIVKDRRLRDNPPAGPSDSWLDRRRGQRFVYNENRPEVHDLLRDWRRLARGFEPERLLMGETYLLDVPAMAAYYGAGDELQLAMNFAMLFARFEPGELRTMAEAALGALGPHAAVWIGSNHDVSRFPTRWCRGDEGLKRLALTMLLTLPGACVLYQGDEMGMEDVAVPEERRRDPFRNPGRDVSRTPIRWTAGPGRGFTSGRPWLPLGEGPDMAGQRADPRSLLHLTRELIRARKQLGGGYEPVAAGPGVWAYRRGDATVRLDFEKRDAAIE